MGNGCREKAYKPSEKGTPPQPFQQHYWLPDMPIQDLLVGQSFWLVPASSEMAQRGSKKGNKYDKYWQIEKSMSKTKKVFVISY